MMSDYHTLLDDLAAEQEDLEAVLVRLAPAQWAVATPSPRWAVRDQVHHLAMFDRLAALAISEPEAFSSKRSRILEIAKTDRDRWLGEAEAMAGSELLDWWQDSRHLLLDALTGVDRATRIPWFGPSMSAQSFGTARLMEVWAHGQDILDALELPREHTDRVRHVAHLGVLTRGWSYRNRGRVPPEADVRVDLVAPSGAQWTWGPADCLDLVVGTAVDFALVVTQRTAVERTQLSVMGDAASSWMEIAQCFAGPPTRCAERGASGTKRRAR